MSAPLGGQELIEVAAAYLEEDPGATYPYAYEQICAQHEVGVSLRSFVSGGYATAARRLAEARANAEPEPPREPPRPTVAPIEPPETALTPAELAREREAFQERQAAKRREEDRRARERNLRLYGRPRPPKRRGGRGNRNHPFQRDFVTGKRKRKKGEHLGPVEYLPPIEFENWRIRR